jgi:hypothetical protein
VPRSAAFLARFFLLAGVLFALWALAGLSDWYSRLVLAIGHPFMWSFTGFQLDGITPTERGLDVFIRKGNQRILLPLQPRELFSGLVPFLALIGASRGLTLARRMSAIAIGVAVFLIFHVGLMVIGPFLATPHEEWVNRIIDVFYAFYGIVGYAALPFLLWFWLTQTRRL